MAAPAMRILITGGSGFVGRHLVAKFADLPDTPDVVVGTYREGTLAKAANVRSVELDITNLAHVRAVIAAEQPTHVIHLAAISAPAGALANVGLAWRVNAEGAVNVALAAFEVAPTSRLLHCSTAEVYGNSFRSGHALDETAAIDPANVYGATKAAADLMIGQLCNAGLKAVRVRPFNHTGPGQSEDFVVPAFAAQIARIERGLQDPVIRVGDLTAQRDFLDVDDVVNAYVAIIRRFDELPLGGVLNIASGRAVAIKTILNMLLSYSNVSADIMPEAARNRAVGISLAVGNAELAQRLLGWTPTTGLDCTLRSVLNYHRGRLSSQAI